MQNLRWRNKMSYTWLRYTFTFGFSPLNFCLAVFLISTLFPKDQRREFYRFSCALEMNSRALDGEEVEKLENDGMLEQSHQQLKFFSWQSPIFSFYGFSFLSRKYTV